VQTFQKIIRVGGVLHTGDVIDGPFSTDPLVLLDHDIVTINLVLVINSATIYRAQKPRECGMHRALRGASRTLFNCRVNNLGSSDTEEQFQQAVQVTDKVVGIVAPIAGAVVSTILGGDPQEGTKIGKAIADGLNTLVSTLSDIFDFLNFHIAPPNCNGEVFHNTFTYTANEWQQAIEQPASRTYTGPQDNSRCGLLPHTKVHFAIYKHQKDYHLPFVYTERPTNVDYSWLSEQQITEADIQGIDRNVLFIMYHSIYAHKELIFYNDILDAVFKQQPWYKPRYRTAQFKMEPTAQLTAIEQFNVNFLKPRFLK
jgi:hypothetical protein